METTIRRVLPIRQDITYWFCFTGAETEIHKIKDDSKIKREKNINRHGQRHIVNVWHLSDPPYFSLLTTFKSPWHCIIKNVFFYVGLYQRDDDLPQGQVSKIRDSRKDPISSFLYNNSVLSHFCYRSYIKNSIHWWKITACEGGADSQVIWSRWSDLIRTNGAYIIYSISILLPCEPVNTRDGLCSIFHSPLNATPLMPWSVR